MANLSQLGRPLQVHTPLDPDTLFITRCSGIEGISELFRFKLHLLAENATEVPFEKLLGAEAAVECQLLSDPLAAVAGAVLGESVPFDARKSGSVKRHIHGIISAFRRIGRAEFTYYEADLVPRLWLLQHQVRCRIFHEKTIGEILQTVLEPLRPHVRIQLNHSYPVRNYTVQYRESDFAFFSRLVEEEGIWYHFEHSRDAHVLVVHDTAAQVQPVPGRSAVHFDDGRGGIREYLRVATWEKQQIIRPQKFRARDYHFQTPQSKLEATTTVADKVKVGAVQHAVAMDAKLEHFEPDGGQPHHHEGIGSYGAPAPDRLKPVFEASRRYTHLRAEQAVAEALTLSGRSTCWHFLPGHSFQLQGHFDGDDTYLLTRVEHDFRGPVDNFRSGADVSFQYENRLTAIPAAVPYRSARTTPRPLIHGIQTAVVVGPLEHEIFLDPYGRVKVQFHWDTEGDQHGSNSCWLRVAQVWAGKNWGAFFWPRLGHEVVVAFEDGDPDRPLIVGSVYNEANQPPVDLPEESRLGGIKSCTFGGDPLRNFNAVVFHDIGGSEHVQVHSQNTDMHNSEAFRLEYAPQANITIHGHM